MPNIKVDLDLKASEINKLIEERSDLKKKITPEFTLPSNIKAPESYKRLQNQDKKNKFRQDLLSTLQQQWQSKDGPEKANHLQKEFLNLTESLDQNGAVIFGDLINKKSFSGLVNTYDQMLMQHGNKSWIHSYVNLANHPDFLSNSDFNGAFLHPLLVALISYQIGGPIRIVDARAKNAEPLSVKAQDNMLHIDNTPFNDEYKIIVKWEKGKASGPKGQNFVIIPGTHKGVRNCFLNNKHMAWSTENGSIFVEPETVQQVFDVQKHVLNANNPVVVEVQHPEKPLTTVFAAGSLVHHRYRTEENTSRSAMIIALHRAEDNPGQFMDEKYIKSFSNPGDLNSYLFGLHGGSDESGYIKALSSESLNIATKISEIFCSEEACEIISQKQRELTPEQLQEWKSTVTSAPTVEHKKIKELKFPLGENIPTDKFVSFLSKNAMPYDKHGPLDLILYADAHEEIRKWARNRIREKKIDSLHERLTTWSDSIVQPSNEHLLSVEEIQTQANSILQYIDGLDHSDKQKGKLDPIETISSNDAYRSLRQLTDDLKEAISRCDSRQTFLSTSLFLFWVVDELSVLAEAKNEVLQPVGSMLLMNYVASSIVIEKQIRHENCNQENIAHNYSGFNNQVFFASNNENSAVETSLDLPAKQINVLDK